MASNALVAPQDFHDEQRNRFILLLPSNEIGLSLDESEHILDAFKDWLNPDNEITGFGAEHWYHALAKPFSCCRNGPVTSIDELTLVRGISPELLYGSGNHPGIAQFHTAYGNDGLININTASPLVLHPLWAKAATGQPWSLDQVPCRQHSRPFTP